MCFIELKNSLIYLIYINKHYEASYVLDARSIQKIVNRADRILIPQFFARGERFIFQ